jgi:radical SAM superfamily enzyme YgiQ (UPF0313 family)
MRILFIYTDIGISVGYSCGIGVLSAYLKRYGHETKLIHVSDELGYPLDPERIVREIKAYSPGLIAFSAVTNQWYFVKQIARFVRRHVGTPIIVGGHHANAVPEQVVAERAIDYACKGEGEKPLLELVNRLEVGLPTDDIPNLTVKRKMPALVLAPAGGGADNGGCKTHHGHEEARHGEELIPTVSVLPGERGIVRQDQQAHQTAAPHPLTAPVAVEAGSGSAAGLFQRVHQRQQVGEAPPREDDQQAVTVADSKAKINETHSHEGGNVIDNKMGKWVQDLDELPFEDREIFQYDGIVQSRHGWAEVIASRGCPYACTYCFNLPFFTRYKNDTKGTDEQVTLRDFVRRRSVESTVAMLNDVRERYPNVKYFTFVDDVFAIYSRWLADLAPVYAKEVGLPFACTTQPLAFNEDIARLLKLMGCKVVKMGVESGNVRIRNQVLNRNIPDHVLIRDFKLARDYGLKPQAFNMIGLPTETRENMMETVRLNAELRAYIVWVSTFMPYPGTVLHDFCVNNDLIDPSKWDEVRSYRGGSVLKETSFSYLELEKVRVLFKWHLNVALENECSAEYRKNIEELESFGADDWLGGKAEEAYHERDPILDKRFRERTVDHYITKKYVNMFWAKEYAYDIS